MFALMLFFLFINLFIYFCIYNVSIEGNIDRRCYNVKINLTF